MWVCIHPAVGIAKLESCLPFSLLDIILHASFRVIKQSVVLKVSLVVGSVPYGTLNYVSSTAVYGEEGALQVDTLALDIVKL